MNHDNYEKRLDFIKSLLKDNYKLEASKIETIAYEPDYPVPYNNYIYRVELPSPTSSEIKHEQVQHGSVPIPSNTSVLVIRLANNKGLGLGNERRVENEVANMTMYRQALSSVSLAHVIPSVYGWASGENNTQGWILMEFKSGINIAEDKPFYSMTEDQTQKVIVQMADAFSAIQKFQVPATIEKFGGVVFDDQGNFVSAPMTILRGGPFDTYEEMWQGLIKSQLQDTENENLNGWRDISNIRERLDRFMETAVGPMLTKLKGSRRTLVNGDFTTANLLHDPETFELTAILDLDFAYIGYAADEFVRSLSTNYGSLKAPPTAVEPTTDSKPQTLLRSFLLKGFPDVLPPRPEEPEARDAVLWDVAKLWNDELIKRGLERPETIDGMEEVAELFWLSERIVPLILIFNIDRPDVTPERKAIAREKAEKDIDQFLTSKGY